MSVNAQSKPECDLKDARKRDRTIFYSLAAQSDNLGDVEIRKVVLEWLLATGHNVSLYTGSMPQDYLDAFGLPPSVRYTTSSTRFQLQLLAELFRRRAHLVFAPGPHNFGSRDASGVGGLIGQLVCLVKPTVNLVNTIAIRMSGGKAVGIGRALRGSGRVSRSLEQAQIRMLNLFCVRDTTSSDAVGMKLRIVPDAAFSNVSPYRSAEKTSVVISLRGDRIVNRTAIAALVRAIRASNREPVFVTQVRSDEKQHEQLAEDLGCSIVSWRDASHADQLKIVKAEYAKAWAVVSDRLHALIFGAQFGAFPVAIVHSGVDKLTSTLAHVLPMAVVRSEEDRWHDVESLLIEPIHITTIFERADLAQADLADLRDEVLAILRT